jgi:hypothetical protein
LRTYEFAPRIIPAVDAYFKGLAPNAGPWQSAFQDMAKTVQDAAPFPDRFENVVC